ncbi:MAG: transglycosylase domain-containing protein, partial [Solirubrobacterales bacterium]
MADPTDFDFDFDVKRSGSDREGNDADRGNGRKNKPEQAGASFEGNGEGTRGGSFGDDAEAGGPGLAPPPSRSRTPRRSDETPPRRRSDPAQPAEPKAPTEPEPGEPPVAGSFDEYLEKTQKKSRRPKMPKLPKRENLPRLPTRDDLPKLPKREAAPKPAKRDDGGGIAPGGGRKLGGIQLPHAPDLSEIGAKLKQLRMPDVGGLRRGGNGGPPLGGTRIRLPFGLGDRPGKSKRGRIKKWRLLIILAGLGLLAMVSSIFGIMMAVSKDLPNLENRTEYNASENSVVYDVDGNKLGTLTSNNNRILIESNDIAQTMKQATISIEDQRFYEHRGVDFQGIGRAVVADVMPGGSTQGASTITQQFVKNALEAQASRTVFEKLREAALAYHLERRWDKDKILTQYMNTIYFGEGAYGIEAAARTYFGYNHPNCGEDGYPRCASLLLPEESAMLAGIISSPAAYSPRANPTDAAARRDLVLDKMAQQGYLTETDADEAKHKPLPSPSQIADPSEDSLSPYFTTWLRQQLVDKYGAGRAFGGGLRIKTTLDLDLQESLESIVRNTLAAIEPTSSIVVIDNKTGGVRAMVGGLDYAEHPFNLATQGHRQPGSSFKPFTLVTALNNGHSSGETYASAPQTFIVPHSGGKEKFEVHNYEDNYLGSASIATATTYSDNSVYSQLGMNITKDPQQSLNLIEGTARKLGIQTDISGDHRANPAMILGGLIEGVTPLEMAYAYSTIADGGEKTSGSLASYKGGPVSMLEIKDKAGKTVAKNKAKKQRVIPESVASEAKSILASVITSGTGERAQTGDAEWGKTGTTDNNGDAWFVGATDKITVAVWVGRADSNEPMDTEFAGQPVDGGTFPALIWAQVINAFDNIEASRAAGNADPGSSSGGGGYVAP